MNKYCSIFLNLLLLYFNCIEIGYSENSETTIVVIGNKKAPVEQINSELATQIFLKQIRTWNNGETIQPIDLKEGSPMRNEFYRKVIKRSPAQLRAYWARQVFTGMGSPPKQVDSVDKLNAIVIKKSNAVGYVDKGNAHEQTKILLQTNN